MTLLVWAEMRVHNRKGPDNRVTQATGNSAHVSFQVLNHFNMMISSQSLKAFGKCFSALVSGSSGGRSLLEMTFSWVL